MKLEMVTPSEAYDSGFAEGVDWATPRIWNEAIEGAAGYHLAEAKRLRRLVRPGNDLISRSGRADTLQFAEEHVAYAAVIRKLRKP